MHDPTLHGALGQTLLLGVLTTVIAVPLGVAFALGLDRWHGRLPSGWNFTMLMSFVVPEIVMGISLYFVVTAVTSNTGSLPWVPFHAGTAGQVIGLVTFQMSYPVIIVRARLLTIGKQYEEAASDLGANRFEALRRVLFPMLFPAIFASAVLVFADVIDDFVIVQKLSSGADTEPVAVKIYNTARGAPTPALNALATLLLLAALIAILVGYLGYRAADAAARARLRSGRSPARSQAPGAQASRSQPPDPGAPVRSTAPSYSRAATRTSSTTATSISATASPSCHSGIDSGGDPRRAHQRAERRDDRTAPWSASSSAGWRRRSRRGS